MAKYHYYDLINFLNSVKGQDKLTHITYSHLNLGIKDLRCRGKRVASTFIGDVADVVLLIYQVLEKDQEAISDWMDKPYQEIDSTYYCYGWSDEDQLDSNNLTGKAVVRTNEGVIECDCNDVVIVLEKDRESDKIFFRTAYPYPEGYSPDDLEWLREQEEKGD